MKIGEKARSTPNKKPATFLNTVKAFFPWSNLSPIWNEKEATSLFKFHKRTGDWIKKTIIVEVNMWLNEGPPICFLLNKI